MTSLLILVVVLVVAVAVGMLYQRRSGRVVSGATPVSSETQNLLRDAGASVTEVTVLHFSADWCGPCAAVRRVVGRSVETLAGAAVELEVDIDDNPALAKALGVMSLPTTFIVDSSLEIRARIAGVPVASELEAAVEALADNP